MKTTSFQLQLFKFWASTKLQVLLPPTPPPHPTKDITFETKKYADLVSTDFALQALDQVTDCHSGGDGVGVDDDIGRDALAGEQHVFLSAYQYIFLYSHHQGFKKMLLSATYISKKQRIKNHVPLK